MEIDRREKNWRQLRIFLLNNNNDWFRKAKVEAGIAVDLAIDKTDYDMETIVVHTKRLSGEEIPLTPEEVSSRLNVRNRRRQKK